MTASVIDHAAHSPYSDPGEHAPLLAALPTDPAALSAVARNVIVHYRADAEGLPSSSDDDIDLRWVSRMLEVDQRRHPQPLAQTRPRTERLQGCCRDHTLLCVAALREHGVPARSRVGFAGYFVDGWHHDHVIVEAWVDGRWRRFDPEVGEPLPHLPTPMDMPVAAADEPGFVSAAAAWAAHRAGRIDAETYGVDPHVPVVRGERFLADEVIYEVAHRFGDELLLWDVWGRMAEPGTPVDPDRAVWVDEIAALLLAADAGDLVAERRLLARYRAEEDLHPSDVIVQASPRGSEPRPVTLR